MTLGLLDIYINRDQHDRVVKEGEKIITLAKTMNYKWAQAQVFNLLSDTYRILDQDEKALTISNQAFQIAGRLADRKTLCDSYFYRARILNAWKNIKQQSLRVKRSLN